MCIQENHAWVLDKSSIAREEAGESCSSGSWPLMPVDDRFLHSRHSRHSRHRRHSRHSISCEGWTAGNRVFGLLRRVAVPGLCALATNGHAMPLRHDASPFCPMPHHSATLTGGAGRKTRCRAQTWLCPGLPPHHLGRAAASGAGRQSAVGCRRVVAGKRSVITSRLRVELRVWAQVQARGVWHGVDTGAAPDQGPAASQQGARQQHGFKHMTERHLPVPCQVDALKAAVPLRRQRAPHARM